MVLCWMRSLPPSVLADQLCALTGSDLARLEICASFLHQGDATFGKHAESVIEFAARASVVRAFRCVAGSNGQIPLCLLPGETWKMLWYLVAAVVQRHRGDDIFFGAEAQAATLALLSGTEAATYPSVVAGLRAAAAATHSTSQLLPRCGNVGTALGRAGQWTQATEMLHVGALKGARLAEVQGPGCAKFLTQMSTFLVDKCYASTYVSSDDGESRDIVMAYEFASRAVELCRSCQSSTSGRIIVASRVRGGPCPESTVPLSKALLAQGRAAALCGQHSGLGAMGPSWCNRIPDVQELFATAQFALREAVVTGQGQDKMVAKAALAETWFCAASASRRTDIYPPASPGRAEFDSLAQDFVEMGATPDLNRNLLPERVLVIGRLILASLKLTRCAVAEMEAAGLGETLEAAQMMKDLGKVHDFASQIPQEIYPLAADADFLDPEERNHQFKQSEWLNKALALQQRLAGNNHKNTANVLRLLGQTQQATEAEAALTADDETEERRAAQYLDQQAQSGALLRPVPANSASEPSPTDDAHNSHPTAAVAAATTSATDNASMESSAQEVQGQPATSPQLSQGRLRRLVSAFTSFPVAVLRILSCLPQRVFRGVAIERRQEASS